jgi:hypothetical protein
LETGFTDPVIQVVDETTGEVVYTLRIRGSTWQPKAFQAGPHTLRVEGQDGTAREFKGVQATLKENLSVLRAGK